MEPVVAALTCYLIKSCAGLPLERATVLPTGIEHDRSSTVIGDDGVCLTQRAHPAMAAIGVRLRDGGSGLTLTAPGAPAMDIDVVLDGKRLPVQVHDYHGEGIDQGGGAAEWFSAVLATSCRLVRMPPDHSRTVGGLTPGTTGFADSQAITVVSHASLDELNARILERGGEPVPIDRFRANLVVAGWQQPHTEDRCAGWRSARRGSGTPSATSDARSPWSTRPPGEAQARSRSARRAATAATWTAMAALLSP